VRSPLFSEVAKAAYLAYQNRIVADPKHRLRWEDLSRMMQEAWIAAVQAAAAKIEERIP